MNAQALGSGLTGMNTNGYAPRMFIRDGVRGIFECGEQDQLEQYVMTKVWDDPEVNVDGLIEESFRLYCGAAADPMKRFYLRLEEIAFDPANYPPPYHRTNGIEILRPKPNVLERGLRPAARRRVMRR